MQCTCSIEELAGDEGILGITLTFEFGELDDVRDDTNHFNFAA